MKLHKIKELRYLVFYVGICILFSLILWTWFPILKTLRVLLSLPLMLFIPGYIFTAILFKKQDIIEKIAMSFVFSIAIVTLTIIFTNNILNVPVNAFYNFIIILTIIIILLLIKALR